MTITWWDLVSNKVNGVDYRHQFGTPAPDAFYHRYLYDAENRIVEVMTSRDSIVWEQDAAYGYYKHGPLARTMLGCGFTEPALLLLPKLI